MDIMPNMEMLRWHQQGFEWRTIPELAADLGASIPQIRRWHRTGKLPARRIGKRIFFLTHEIGGLLPMISSWLESRKPLVACTDMAYTGDRAGNSA